MKSRYDRMYAALVDAFGARCMHCGTEDDLVVDHVVSIAKGGLSEFENLQLLCRTCNNTKGKLIIDCRPASE